MGPQPAVGCLTNILENRQRYAPLLADSDHPLQESFALLPKNTRSAVEAAEHLAAEGSISGAYRKLRELPLADFVALPDVLPRAEYPALSGMIATMPSAEIQRRWTGHAGHPLLVKTCSTIRLVQLLSYHVRGRDLGAGPILDYGCGWGRVMRGFGYFADPADLHGADPMEDSLTACREHDVKGNLHKVAAVPQGPAIDVSGFDLIFSFSVMTHTSMEVTSALLSAVRPLIASDGIYTTTIRPPEFWTMRAQTIGEQLAGRMISAHDETGYAFMPAGGGKELLTAEYGDSSYSIECFSALAAKAGWSIARIDRDTLEPWQLTICLKPA